MAPLSKKLINGSLNPKKLICYLNNFMKFNKWFSLRENQFLENQQVPDQYAAAYQKILAQTGNEQAAKEQFDKLMATPMGQYRLLQMSSSITQPYQPKEDPFTQNWQANSTSGQQMMQNRLK